MKAIITSLMILMVSFAIAQSPMYTYKDANNNTYELFSGVIKYAPATGAAKTVNITKTQTSELERKFQAAIAAKTEQQATGKLSGGTVMYPGLKNNTLTIYMISSSATKAALETALAGFVQ